MVLSVTRLEHLTVVLQHLLNGNRVVPAVLRTIVINTTDVLILFGQLAQPRAAFHCPSGYRAYPDFAIADVAKNARPVSFPPIDFAVGRSKITTTVIGTTLAALIAVLHEITAFMRI